MSGTRWWAWGALKGAPCQIQEIRAENGGYNITFLWVDNDGNPHTGAITLGKTFVHTQSVPADVWTIQHNLKKQVPVVLCVDGGGNRILGDPEYYSENLTRVRFSQPLTGTAYLS